MLVLGVLLSSQPNVNASTEAATKFDGNWAATAYFPEYKDPSGPIAKAVTMNFFDRNRTSKKLRQLPKPRLSAAAHYNQLTNRLT